MSQQRAIRNALWRRGELSWYLREYQKPVYDAIREHEETGKGLYVLNCARRFGKSTILLLICIEDCLRNPYTVIKYAAPTRKQLNDFIIDIIRKITETCPADVKPTYEKTEKVLTFPNGSRIHMDGTENGNAEYLRGAAANKAVLDECGFMMDLDYVYRSILAPQVRDTGGIIVAASTPSKTPDHDFRKIAEQAMGVNAYSEFDIYAKRSFMDEDEFNEMMEEIEFECGGFKSATFKREYLCQWAVDESLVIIPEWEEVKGVKTLTEEDYERPQSFRFMHKYEAMDLGVRNDYTACLFAYYDFPRAVLVVEDEFVIKGPELTTNLLSTMIEDKEKELWGKNVNIYRRVADSDNPLLINDLNQLHDLNFMATSKDHLEGMVNLVRTQVGQGQIEIHERCIQLIGCLNYGIYDKHRRKFSRSAVYGHYDALAALVYLVRNIDRYTNPIPNLLGLDRTNSHIRSKKKMDTEETLSAALGVGQ